MSGGEKNTRGRRLKEHAVAAVSNRLFLGAGGQVVISGIRNLSAFGVEQIELQSKSKSKFEGFAGETAAKLSRFSPELERCLLLRAAAAAPPLLEVDLLVLLAFLLYDGLIVEDAKIGLGKKVPKI